MTAQQSAFFKSVVPAAQASQAASGVPASVTLAQAILESGWGGSQLAKVAKNYFGIKAAQHAQPGSYVEFATIEWMRGRKITQLAEFAKYATEAECFAAHAALISTAGRYAPAMRAKGDARQFCVQLQACGYSTSMSGGHPDYANKLLTIIQEFDLTQYDAPVAPAPPPQNGGGKPLPTPITATSAVSAQSASEVDATTKPAAKEAA